MNQKDEEKSIKFNLIELQNLIGLLNNEKIKRKLEEALVFNRLFKNGHQTNKFYVLLTPNEIELILNELTYIFTSKGIDKTSEPNRLGIKIEGLIDIFYDKRFDL